MMCSLTPHTHLLKHRRWMKAWSVHSTPNPKANQKYYFVEFESQTDHASTRRDPSVTHTGQLIFGYAFSD